MATTQKRFTRWVALPGSEKQVPPGASAAAAVAGTETFEVTVRLRRKKPLPALAARPERVMTRAEYAARHGASSADVARVAAFAKHFGLQVADVQAAARSVVLRGTADRFERAFQVELRRHEMPDGTSYRGREGSISIPAELAAVVEGVFGLDDRPVVRRFARHREARHAVGAGGADGAYFGNQLARLYGFPAGLDGRGEAIGLVELGGGFVQADLDLYFKEAGVSPPPNVTVATVPGGASNAPAPQGADQPDVEVLLDIEMAGSAAPGAKLVMYFARDASDRQTLAGLLAAIHDEGANVSVISLSWGGIEYDASFAGQPGAALQKQYQDNVNAALLTAAHLGITVCVASGDNASAGAPSNQSDGRAHVLFPASSPYALACGGTHLLSAADGTPVEEAWHPQAHVGTGGGISRYFKVPSYQRRAVRQHAVNPPGGAGRGVPDVAANAAQESGYRVRVDGRWYPAGSERPAVGGTSAATPLWAALITCLNQGLGARLGFVNPLLYRLAARSGALRDVTRGDNDDYQAQAGWDPCTGLGTPNGARLLAALRPLVAGGTGRGKAGGSRAHAGNEHAGNEHAGKAHADKGHAGKAHADKGHAGKAHSGKPHAGTAAAANSAASRSVARSGADHPTRGPGGAPATSRAAAQAAQAARRRREPVPVPSDARDEARHILMFDSDDPATYAPHTVPAERLARAAAMQAIPWPQGKAPQPQPLSPAPAPDDPLPQCDYLVVTWTVEEAKALADVLTPGFPSKTAWYHYTHNFTTQFVPIIRKGAPAVEDSHRLASYFLTTIDGKRVLCVKSELHMSQDGPKLPIADLWRQMIAECRPQMVITTGTAGGIGAAVELGDVVVAPAVRFDCQKEFKNAAFHDSVYTCSKLKTAALAEISPLVAANLQQLPAASRPPAVFSQPTAQELDVDVVTTDFFAFDDATDTYHLQGLGGAVEMGDAVLGLVISQLGKGKPRWTAVRNASDPQIANAGLTAAAARKLAAQIYERYGYWTTVPSAIACWAVVLGN